MLLATDALEQRVRQLIRQLRLSRYAARAGQALRPLQPPPVLEDADRLREVLRGLEEAGRTALAVRSRRAVLKPLGEPPKLRRAAECSEHWRQLKRALERREHAARRVRGLARLARPPALRPVEDLQELMQSLKEGQTERAAVCKELQGVTARFEQAQAAIRKWVLKNPVCPTCGGKITAARLQAHLEEGLHG
jgi:tRNA(Ile2) C34 agmatinyltransferase TiaS